MAARKRHDPPSRPPEYVGHDKVTDTDDDLHYVFANPNDPFTGLDHYLGLGYEPVAASSGTKAVRGKVVDGKVTSLNQVLVAGPRSIKDQADQHGWAHAKAVDKRILQDQFLDGSRGEPGIYKVRTSVEVG